MGKVSAVLEVKPDGPEVDLDDLLERCEAVLPESAKISDSQREPVGFGVEKLVVQVIIPDEAGGANTVEHQFEELDGVQSVDVKSVGRV